MFSPGYDFYGLLRVQCPITIQFILCSGYNQVTAMAACCSCRLDYIKSLEMIYIWFKLFLLVLWIIKRAFFFFFLML